jgi:hypothetical protein
MLHGSLGAAAAAAGGRLLLQCAAGAAVRDWWIGAMPCAGAVNAGQQTSKLGEGSRCSVNTKTIAESIPNDTDGAEHAMCSALRCTLDDR